jgi:hypothetical protein
MDRAIGMYRATVTYGAKLPLFFWLFAHCLKRRQNFFPGRIALFHSIYFPLMLLDLTFGISGVIFFVALAGGFA